MLKFLDVWKRYGDWILKGVDVEVRDKVLIHGPNGSGKTTLVKLAAGLLEPTRGRVERRGRPGVLLQHPLLHPDLTVEENLAFYAKALGTDFRDWAEKLGLGRYLKTRFSHLSYGWKRRADLARALLGEPDILILDEPLLGLDSEARQVVVDILNSYRGPLLVTASSPCDYLAIKVAEIHQIKEGGLVPRRPECSSS